MKKNVFSSTLKKVKQIEKTRSLEEFVVQETFSNQKHRMKMKEAYCSFATQIGDVYQNLADLELADLVDENFFVGEFDGKYSQKR